MHPRNACGPMLSMPWGNEGGDSLPHLQKAPSPIDFSPSGRFVDSSDPHLKKAYLPISLTVSGITTLRRAEFPLKAPLPILVITHLLPPTSADSGIRTSVAFPEYFFTAASEPLTLLKESPGSMGPGGSGIFSGLRSSANTFTARLSRPVPSQILPIIA
ncbi:MAG: hypothetical protein J5674_05500 [Candidatus Methanomethylophilaceae archaeon]|nr:hypothetical protein [Candidatus Methanomethylophilaceae archaeon]